MASHAPARALVVIPTYNERENVQDIAAKFLAALPGCELLFVVVDA